MHAPHVRGGNVRRAPTAAKCSASVRRRVFSSRVTQGCSVAQAAGGAFSRARRWGLSTPRMCSWGSLAAALPCCQPSAPPCRAASPLAAV